jgi:hypothetical protein
MYVINEFIFNFWIWWYYDSLSDLLVKQRDFLINLSRLSGLSVHLKYLFVPLYQQKDFWSRFISILFRMILVIFGIVIEAIALVGCFAFLIVYLILPILPLLKIWMVVIAN